MDGCMDGGVCVSVQESKEKLFPVTNRLDVCQVVEDTGKYPGLA